MARPKLVVVGSSNMDMVVKTERIPRGGETVLGGDFVMVPGGKGANQAVCAAKLGADVALVARVGEDVFGEKSFQNFEATGVDTRFVTRDQANASGVALIAVDASGENAIVVAPNANSALAPADVDAAREAIAGADAVILQLEIPAETVAHTVELAHSLGVRVVLNPAPMRPMSKDILAKVDVLVPNEHEAAGLVGREMEPQQSAAELLQLGAGAVVITLGSKGAYAADARGGSFVAPARVQAVDTTAAGDAFTASLAFALAEGKGLVEAAGFASRVAAISVTRMGAQSSMPSREEVDLLVFGN